ncbi:MAG: XdhC family protein [Halobacteriota archaeon]
MTDDQTHTENEHDEHTHRTDAVDTVSRPIADGGDSVTTHGRLADGDISTIERDLTEAGRPYARAIVVRREPPVSANVGDRALVTASGELHGWIGGAACAQTIVTMQAREAIESGTPRLIGIAPDPDTVDRPGLEAFPMTCHSDGVLEVFIEPVTPPTELVIVGDSPVAASLARLAAELALDVTVVVGDADRDLDVPAGTTVRSTLDHEAIADSIGDRPIVVVASMGKYDAHGIAAGLSANAPYVGLIASDARAAEEIDRAASLLEADVDAVEAAVTNPAGVDIAAYTPTELAVSLLAEIVDVRSRGAAVEAQSTDSDSIDLYETESTTAVAESATAEAESTTAVADSATPEAESTTAVADSATAETESATAETESTVESGADGEPAIDPVCGMTVDPADAAATVEHEGETYFFCCQGCADTFATDPSAYRSERDRDSAEGAP